MNSSESFTIFLGADSGVKIEHKCLGNFQESSGIFQKVHNKKFKSKIIIKNNKKQPVKIAAYEQLPKSSDASIKVKLIEPVIEEGSKKVKVTEANNVSILKGSFIMQVSVFNTVFFTVALEARYSRW